MRIITVNLNGIRSANSKGFFEWLQTQQADVICLQEIRIMHEQLSEIMLNPGNLKSTFEFSEKRGYSGVGMYFSKSPEHRKWVQSLETVKTIKLSPAVMETLAIVAYKQPLTRAGIEFIRGVDSSHTIRRLMQQKLVRIVGREMIPGRPGLYGTTKHFLEVFGLTNLKHLPALSELDMNKPAEENQLELPLQSEEE